MNKRLNLSLYYAIIVYNGCTVILIYFGIKNKNNSKVKRKKNIILVMQMTIKP